MKKYTRLVPFLNIIKEFIESKNGYELAGMLNVKILHSTGLMKQISQPDHARDLCRKNLPRYWDDTIYSQLRALYHYQTNNVVEACLEQKNCVLAFHRLFPDLDRWSLPIHYIIHSDLYYLSVLADKELIANNKKAGNLEEAARAFNKAFTYCVIDRRVQIANSRKWGTYYIANLLFKTYFKLKSISLCKNIQRAIDAGDMPKLEEYPIAEQTTFHYYSGLLLFLEEQYHEAEKHLLKAFKYTKGKSEKNELIIIHLLIPIRLLSGVIPSYNLLNYHSSIKSVYGGMVDAIRSGNIRQFDQCLKENEKELLKYNTYLTIEKCRLLCIRRLFKKVYFMEGKLTRMKVTSFQQALKFVGVDVKLNEVECLLAIMVDKGYIRGYISHEKSILVLSATNAFPNVTSISLA
ncbi:hypothetical protein BCR36DRAFT_353660 [Piromyces finnis]|uniref:PCI domain-containing protein n=1 Tax=Piromyces finnis TaxID=1754191 RepID=A0A1Y1V8R7_9FUNG|nr:hypothetical protein BCR36DRAFT_353660 [Piromyces finnis]|eukprot:ORX49263.1 hypothetical protein BCR36DRAFT_353660 [Piromyces finnis]